MADAVLLPDPPIESVEDYLGRREGGAALERARSLGPGGTIQEIQLSGLRGRGGAGFPTARKWRTVREEGDGDRYLVCNGAEGEPGTFKDRTILRADPYQVIEGVAIAAMAVGAKEAFIAVKESFTREIERLERALVEMAKLELIGDAPITLVAGPEEYLFGEETGLLQVVEGDAPLPRLFPPYLHGLFATAPNTGWSGRAGLATAHPPTEFGASNPTLINNVETLATVTHILKRGAEWHRSLGTRRSPGLVVCTVVGDVVRPGVAELPLGTPLAEVIDRVGGGVAPGRRVKAVLSGVSNPVVTADQLGTPITYEDMEAIGSGLGSCGFIVYDDTASAVEIALVHSRFLYVESCGQCPACKLGTGEITAQLAQLSDGEPDDEAIAVIGARLRSVTDGNRCYLPIEEQRLIASLLRAFPEEFVAAESGNPPPMRGLHVAKLLDVSDGRQVFDEKQSRKQPDWTFS